jgi:hypothetical protein
MLRAQPTASRDRPSVGALPVGARPLPDWSYLPFALPEQAAYTTGDWGPVRWRDALIAQIIWISGAALR